MTRSDFNNNPGNLRPPPGVKYEGMIGVDDKGFAIFENKDYGRRALINDINKKISDGLNTPDKFINKYTPASEENPEDSRDNYKIFIATRLGLNDTGAEFPKNAAERLADAITQFEGTSLQPAEDTAESPTLQQKVQQLVDQSKDVAKEAVQTYPEEARIGFDVAGGVAGAKIGQGLESMRTDFERQARQEQIRQRAAARAAAVPTAPTPEGGTPGERWARKVVGEEFIKPGVQSSTEASRDFKRAIPSGKTASKLPTQFNMPHLPGEGQPMSIADRLIARQKAAELAAQQAAQQAAANPPPRPPSALSRGASSLAQGINIGARAFPGITGALSGVAAADLGQQAYQRASQGDIPGAAIAGMGSVGALASMLPFPLTKVGGPAIVAASPLTLLLYDKLKDRAVSQAQGFKALAEGAQLPTPSIYSPYER
jgi:hypothetical protein